MKIGKQIFFIFLICHMTAILYGQAHCNLYIDDLRKEDSLKIAIKTYTNRNEKSESILVYKAESKYYATINSDSLKNLKIELTQSQINAIRLFEIGVRNQNLISNVPQEIHSRAEYEIRYKQGFFSFFSKENFYSLVNGLLKSQ